ncbi:hypothetical protein BFQ30_08270 [Haemophilus quentini]|uniref:DUF2570 domain-containing protein n=2 Tax=Haemophilus TaxID=724 RepID=A0ABX3BPG5_9PAST|nr:DUF2570 family protein [Haemophilus quentini]EGT78790.1 Hypothetical protein GGE_2188 [Haemophilus haemolyticus M21639]OEY75842.1 hypothetical protein BFQ29_08685 [Haemophilus quentini]OEY76587.1 hypothetical protein BFQ30_08270 [Haemophilus quentini]ORC33821.1 hypothetical protein BES36_010150 [Haemophilus quentini]
MTKYIYIALGTVVVVLFGVLRYQSSVIDELNITTKQQAQTIQQQSESIIQLKADIAENQRITLELSKAENASREEQNEVLNSIPKAEKQSSVFNTAAPNSLINFLRK